MSEESVLEEYARKKDIRGLISAFPGKIDIENIDEKTYIDMIFYDVDVEERPNDQRVVITNPKRGYGIGVVKNGSTASVIFRPAGGGEIRVIDIPVDTVNVSRYYGHVQKEEPRLVDEVKISIVSPGETGCQITNSCRDSGR